MKLRSGRPSWGRRMVFVAALGASLALAGDAFGEGVGMVTVSKSIPEATVAVIDPESGTSAGTGSTDVRLAAGDIILFRFRTFPVPQQQIEGVNSWLTEYIPPNLQVVGVRLIDDNELTIPVDVPGLAEDGTAVSANSWTGITCSGGTCPPPDGGIAQVYQDTGIFYSTDPDTARIPDDAFITLDNGQMVPDPAVIGSDSNLRAAIGVDSPFYAHNLWDARQVSLFGVQGGNTPHLFGSPVAGPDTHYQYEASGTIASPTLTYSTGPWDRIQYPGSVKATGGAATSRDGNGMGRYIVDAADVGFDLTPNNPLPHVDDGDPASANALRIAAGAVRGGRPLDVEIAFRVMDTPLDPAFAGTGGDINCGESWGGDIAGSPTGADASNNPWSLFAPTPGCVFLNLLFDITSNEVVRNNDETGGPGTGQNDMTLTIRARNLSTLPRNNVWVRQKYNASRIALSDDAGVSVYPDIAPTCTIADCDGDGLSCIYWSLGTLDPSEEVTIRTNFEVSNGGDPTTPIRADFSSDDLGVVTGDPCAGGSVDTPGFVTQETVQIRSLGVIDAELSTTTPSVPTTGGTATVTGTVSVSGTNGLTMNDLWLTLPSTSSDWVVADTGGPSTPDVTYNGVRYECDAFCGTNTPRFEGINEAMAVGDTMPVTFDVVVPSGTSAGNYPVDLHLITGQTGYGGRKEFMFNDATLVPVGGVRSDPPVLDCPILSSFDAIPGTTTEADGTVIRIYFNGIVRGQDTATGGAFDVADSPPPDSGTPWSDAGGTFGSLYGGLEVRATAQAPGENESELSAACFVQAVPQCSDGEDNDGDGLADFPADPGCSSPTDPDESTPECSDGMDNDGDGDTDYPDDLDCASPDDTTEGGGTPECNDGIDNDGDGATDTADGCCDDASDPSETCFRQCNDRIDNDGDTDVDFGADLGCHAVNDDDETDLTAATDVFARLLFVFDTSGSMNWNTCTEDFTGGDGTLECPGNDVLCGTCGSSGCGNTIADDSRIDKAKRGLSNVVAAYGEVEWGLMRFHQRPISFACPTFNASAQSGGWQGAGGDCSGSEFDAGDLLVGFGNENQYDLLEWMDAQSNYPGGTPPAGMDLELRGTGTTPIAGSLGSALTYLGDTEAADPRAACRPYRVILITDGQETCGGDPVSAADALNTAGYPTYVIGFAVADAAAISDLNAIASAGGTGSAIFVDDETALSAEVADIVSDTVLVETCNGVDDDCDTLIDEGFTKYCDRPSGIDTLTVCTDPGETVCDGLDDNCNGLVDEGLLNACGTCGATPTEICDGVDNDCDGVTDEGCPPDCPAEPEICDGIDNDCDGSVDEGLTRSCGTDVGECTTGIETCTAGTWGGCTATGGSTEVCDGLDNDCDGVVDGLTRSCGTDVGVCSPGTEVCESGDWSGVCVGEVTGSTEVCNTLDDDCDGSVDEGNPGGGGTCGSDIGECDAGTFQCTGGVLVCTGGTSPSAEVCNNLDDDCDGVVDEAVPTGGSCGDATGECREGVLTCDGAGSFVCVGARGPTTEVCDGLDNDCDGTADEGDPGGGDACGTDTGECSLGTTACVSGSLVCTGGDTGSAELCNTLDDDCDGVIDEGNPEGGADCGDTDVGECELGTLTCVSGSLECIGDTGPVAEICDGLDNDCDGTADEGNPEGGDACGDDTGECTPGTTLCSGGTLICDGATEPEPEICDGLDNDCDGVIDDGIPVGAACGSDVGECVPGVNVCIDGDIVCEGELGPVDEVCNALDDDCDGAVDEELGLGGPCGMSEGLCMEGMIQCVGGRERCVGEVPPAREACDCLDNDCDGMTDEPPDSGELCAGDAECIECECARECVVSEFSPPCPAGKEPREIDGTCWCLTPPEEECMDEECAMDTVEVDGEAVCAPDTEGLPSCVCKEGTCTFACDGVVCGDGLVCRASDGRCGPEECPFLPCGSGELCDLSTGECFADPCDTVTCDAGEACRLGECEPSCATVECDTGEICDAGVCVTDTCAGVDCGSTEVCDPEDGSCVDNMCLGVVCREGTVCDPLTGGCGPLPCYGLTCPDMEECDPDTGECVAEMPPETDSGVPEEDAGTTMPVDAGGRPDFDAGPPDVHVIATGGGGCTCSAAGADERSTGDPWLGGLLGLALAGLLVWRRRSR